MHNILASVLFIFFVSLSTGQAHNVTVVDTDPSITYEGPGTGDANICKFFPNGTFVDGQPGCYNVANNCTTSAAMGMSSNAAASFKFQGSAIYINSLLNSLSPVYTVNLDGNLTNVDGSSIGARSGPFACFNLFSATNLDPSIEHTVRLSVEGPSPSRNMTLDPTGSSAVFSLINFTYTVLDGSSSNAPAAKSLPLALFMLVLLSLNLGIWEITRVFRF